MESLSCEQQIVLTLAEPTESAPEPLSSESTTNPVSEVVEEVIVSNQSAPQQNAHLSQETKPDSIEPELSVSSEDYVIKTYTCQPLSKMDVREALVGTNKKFECQVIGFPPPTIRWFKDNQEITHDPRYHFSHDHEDGVVSMHIEVIKLSDAGLYQCRAENCEGYAITAAHLQVKGW